MELPDIAIKAYEEMSDSILNQIGSKSYIDQSDTGNYRYTGEHTGRKARPYNAFRIYCGSIIEGTHPDIDNPIPDRPIIPPDKIPIPDTDEPRIPYRLPWDPDNMPEDKDPGKDRDDGTVH